MKRLTRIGLFVVVGIFALSVIPAVAFDCPNTHKAVMAYYEKTMKKSGHDMAKLEQAKKQLDEGMKAHESWNHRKSMDDMAEAMKLITAATP